MSASASFWGCSKGTYAKGDNFRKFVVEPAVLEVNGLSELNCAIKLHRAHSRAPVKEVLIGWEKKTPDQYREAYRELQRSKLGRKARLRGEVVETISPTQTDLEDFTK